MGRSLLVQLNKLKAMVSGSSKGHAQASTCVMVRSFCFFSFYAGKIHSAGKLSVVLPCAMSDRFCLMAEWGVRTVVVLWLSPPPTTQSHHHPHASLRTLEVFVYTLLCPTFTPCHKTWVMFRFPCSWKVPIHSEFQDPEMLTPSPPPPPPFSLLSVPL